MIQRLAFFVVLSAVGPLALPQDKPIELREGLAISGIGRSGRLAVPVDSILSQMAKGEYFEPRVGSTVARPAGGTATWAAIKANQSGWFEGPALNGGYVYLKANASKDCTMILEASGHSLVYINGGLRAGDPYGYGYLHLPVQLKKGSNDLLFSVGRGRLHATLNTVSKPITLDLSDLTLPDAVPSDQGALLGGVVVCNSTDKEVLGLKLVARAAGGWTKTSNLPTIPPMTIRKVPFWIPVPRPAWPGDEAINIGLLDGPTVLDVGRFNLHLADDKDTHKQTFLSGIDGSVQYYGVNPAQKPDLSNALVLTLHGASVEGIGQASAYGHKDWATLVAPTNRRPYGFDWEDVGRLDAMEVLDQAERTIPHDPMRVLLTGHSMGGHGTWHLGLTFPDRFAAIAPSAGWSSFFSYGGTPRYSAKTPTEQILQRALNASDTLNLTRNSLHYPVYILHGDADDNVPVSEARLMYSNLSAFHPMVTKHEEPGAGHWWGNACVDWPPLFELFEKSRLPEPKTVTHVEYVTASPSVSASCDWATIVQQEASMAFSKIDLSLKGGILIGTTSNVAMLAIDQAQIEKPLSMITIDGQLVEMTSGKERASTRWFQKVLGLWLERGAPGPLEKNPARSGPFKNILRNRIMLVYGTRGTVDENRWSYDKARYDSETLYYRGNGATDIISDTQFLRNPQPNRNVILYGNADTNAAWGRLIQDCPISVRKGSVQVGPERFSGKDLSAMFIYPRADSKVSMVGVVAGTGMGGCINVSRLPIISSGIAFPDWIVLSSDSLLKGTEGVKSTGFFSNTWQVDK